MDTSRAKEVAASCCRLAIIILSLFVLTACGGGGGGDNNGSATTGPSTDPGAPPGDAPAFALSVTPSQQTIAQGGSALFNIHVEHPSENRPDGFTADLTGSPLLAATDADGNISYSFTQTDDSNFSLLIKSGRDVPTGNYAFNLITTAGDWNDTTKLLLSIASSPSPPMAPGRWEEIDHTRMRDVCAPKPDVGSGDCRMVIEAWGGGALDPESNRLYVLGGGHNDYYGNEVYAFDIDTRSWHRVTDPTPPPPDAAQHCYTTWDDGKTPTARHTYNNLAWITDQHKLVLYGGALPCASSHGANDTWLFDPKTATWTRLLEHSTAIGGYLQLIYDPVDSQLYMYIKQSYGYAGVLYSFDFTTNEWTKLAAMNIPMDVLYRTATLDTRRRQIWFLGNGSVYVLSIAPGATPALTAVTTTGATAIVDTWSPGVAYDPVRDRIVAWCGGDSRCASDDAGTATTADQVYWLNPETLEWTVDQPPGGPSWSQQRGTFGRWRYSPESDLFIAVNSADRNVWFYHPPSATAAN